MSKIDVLGVSFDNVSMSEAVAFGVDAIEKRSGAYVVTPNPEMIMQALEDEELMASLHEAQLVLPDGIGVIYGAKILGIPLREKVPGIDFAAQLMEKLSKMHGSVFLFGAQPGVAALAAEKLSVQFPGLQISGYADGYFDDDRAIIEQINHAEPDLLLVCLGVPKQEIWMRANYGKLNVGLMAGLGGSLDVFAGKINRAPARWQKLGLEWLYRLLKQPSRFRRMLKLPLFLLCVIKKRVMK